MTKPAAVKRFGWAVQRRSLKRGSAAHLLSLKGVGVVIFATRRHARDGAAQFRVYGVAATPVRVRVTVEAI